MWLQQHTYTYAQPLYAHTRIHKYNSKHKYISSQYKQQQQQQQWQNQQQHRHMDMHKHVSGHGEIPLNDFVCFKSAFQDRKSACDFGSPSVHSQESNAARFVYINPKESHAHQYAYKICHEDAHGSSIIDMPPLDTTFDALHADSQSRAMQSGPMRSRAMQSRTMHSWPMSLTNNEGLSSNATYDRQHALRNPRWRVTSTSPARAHACNAMQFGTLQSEAMQSEAMQSGLCINKRSSAHKHDMYHGADETKQQVGQRAYRNRERTTYTQQQRAKTGQLFS